MAFSAINEMIGVGIYTVDEASLYSGVSTNKLNYWFFGQHPVIPAKFFRQKVLTFYEYIAARAIERAREKGVALPKIRQAIKRANDEHGLNVPLARKHRLILLSGELYIEFPNKEMLQVSGYPKGQRAMPLGDDYQDDLMFDEDGLVQISRPFNRIILDPTRQFGQPLVENTGYRADILSDAYEAEGSADIVALSFGVESQDVLAAVSYMKSLRAAA